VKILDFGIAKIGAAPGDNPTGVVRGKLRYMAPELITGEDIDRRTDIFAVGVMLWEAAAGDRMWRDMGEATIMNRLVNGEFPSPRDVRPGCSTGLERICMKAMAYKKEDRHATAAELQLEIECLLGEMGQQVTSHNVGDYVSGTFAEARQQTRRLVEDKLRDDVSLSLAAPGRVSSIPGQLPPSDIARAPGPRAKRERWAVGAMIALMVLLAAAAAWWLARRRALSEASVDLSVPPRASAVTEPDTVLVRITVFPARAAIYLDDQPVWSNPFSAQKPADRRAHMVRAEAPGHITSSREIRLDKNVDLVIALDPQPADGSISKPRAPGATSEPKPNDRARTEPAPASQAPSCDPPYSVDERGIKKFKPECL
jgi:serine/threonine-protein kinase